MTRFAAVCFCLALGLGMHAVHVYSQGNEDAREKLKRRESKQESDEVFERMEFERLRTCDPATGLIPADKGMLERAYLQSYKNLIQSSIRIQSTTPSIRFRPVGPSNVGGRTKAFAVDYSRPNIMLAGGATGGIWRSVDAGSTWVRVSELSDIQNVSCIVQDPSNPDRWYVGTGEVLSTTDRRTSTRLRTICTGSGVYRSTNAGLQWERISPAFHDQPNQLSNDFQGVWRLIATGDTTGVELYAACYGSIYRVRKGNFERMGGDTSRPSFCTELSLSSDRKTLYAAYGADDLGRQGSMYGIWASRDVDHKVWRRITPDDFPKNIRRITMCTAPSNPDILYVFAQAPVSQDNRYVAFSSYHYLWWHRDSAQSKGAWEQRKEWLDSVQINTLAGYAMCLAVHPEDENVVFLAGTDLYRTSSGFAKTDDAMHLGGYPYIVEPGVLHPDIHQILFSRTAPYRFYAVGDGGLAFTDEPMSNLSPYWKSLNNGYNATQCYSVAQDEFVKEDSLLCVSLQDNSNYVTRQPGRNKGWKFCGGGDGTCAQICAMGEMVIASSQYAYTLYAFGFGADDQADYTVFASPPGSSSIATPFVTSFRLVQRRVTNDTILVLSIGNRLFHFDKPAQARLFNQSEDYEWKEWANIGKTIPSSTFICSITPSKALNGFVYLGCTNGTVYQADLRGETAVLKKLTSLPVSGFVSSIDCDADGNIAVSLSNYNTQAVFMSTEIDSTWIDISDELRLDITQKKWGPSVRCLRFYTDPLTQARFLLAGTSVGLFACSFDQQKTSAWTAMALNTVGSMCIEAMSLRDLDGRLILATHGAGVYESVVGDDTNGVDSTADQYFDLEQNYPNPVRLGTFIRYHTATESHVQLDLFDSMGKKVHTLVDEFQAAGAHKIEVGAEVLRGLTSGIYYYKLQTPTSSSSKILSFVR